MNGLSFVSAWSAPLPAAVAVLAGVTLLLLLAMLIQALLPRPSAATRHLVWRLALVGSLAIGLAVALAPGLSFPVGILSPGPAASPMVAELSRQPLDSAAERSIGGGSAREWRSEISPDPRSNHPRGGRMLLWIWLAGSSIIGAWYCMGYLALARLTRDAKAVTESTWLHLLREEAVHCGWRSPIRLLRTARVGSPVTWRARTVVLLLPAESASWSIERCRAVIAHELAHAARGDHQANGLAAVVCALYWFHPLVWYAARRMRAESERACDDVVLSQGISGGEYASLLLDVARASRELRLAGVAAIGMARPSQLEGRLLALLDEKRPRNAPSRRFLAIAWATLAVVTLPLASLRPSPLPREQAFAGTSEEYEAASTSSYSEKATSGQRLELDLESGGGVRITGWNESRVQVRAMLGGVDWRDTRVALERVSGGLRLHSWQAVERSQSSTSHRFEIQVPRKYDIRLRSAGGDLTLSNLEGDFRGQTGGGEIVIENVRGYASLSTGGGEVHVSDSHLRGSVSTGGGEVLLSGVSGGLRGSSGSGPVVYGEDGSARTTDLSDVEVEDDEIQVARPDKAGFLHVSRAGGDVHLDEAPKGARISTGGGDVTVGRSGGTIDADTGGGDIEIGPSSGSVSARTGAGRVRVTIVRGSSPEHSVEISSGSGPAVIELPADLSARFEIETAYTDGHGKKTRIVSDFPLKISETSTWDTSEGSPRRYVRGTGTAGKGGGLVVVKIVNGDVTIRRK
ncbi:MAG TPA: M56 family metallopeptidase [Candidatus Eisenbacteria bacterium]|nr:M56 family metallopeptidase [Candidatus Eisenbacteria bacterium]